MEMGKFVPQVFRHFDIEWTSPKPEWRLMLHGLEAVRDHCEVLFETEVGVCSDSVYVF